MSCTITSGKCSPRTRNNFPSPSRHSVFTAFFFLMLTLLILAGCPISSPDPGTSTDGNSETGSIVISFTDDSAQSRNIKTWTPDVSMNIESYGITLTGPDDAVRITAVSADEAASSVTIDELQTGYWDVTIEAFNGPVTESELAESCTAECIASGCASDILVTADSPAEASVPLSPLAGTGTLIISRIAWDPADGSDTAAFITEPYAKITITDAAAATSGDDAPACEIQEVFALDDDGTPLPEDSTAAPYAVEGLEAGWYRATVSIYDGDPDSGLFDSSVHCWTSPYSFRIISGHATDITIQHDEITYGTAPLSLSVSAEMQHPFEVYFTAVSNDTPSDPSRTNSYFDSGETIIITPNADDFSDQALFSWYADGSLIENPQPAHPDSPDDHAIACTFNDGGVREIALFVLEPADSTQDGSSLNSGACCGCGRMFHIDQETLVFDANGGSGSMQPVTLALGSSAQLPENQFTPPEGNLFDHWNTAPDASDDAYTVPCAYTAGTESQKTVLYAIWKTE